MTDHTLAINSLIEMRARLQNGTLRASKHHSLSVEEVLGFLAMFDELDAVATLYEGMIAKLNANEADDAITDPEHFRREAPSASTLPLGPTEDDRRRPLDYATAGMAVQRAMHHLDESLPTGQRRRGELAYRMLREGTDDLGVWMRRRGYRV